jgi:hypothetical protein
MFPAIAEETDSQVTTPTVSGGGGGNGPAPVARAMSHRVNIEEGSPPRPVSTRPPLNSGIPPPPVQQQGLPTLAPMPSGSAGGAGAVGGAADGERQGEGQNAVFDKFWKSL